MLAMGANSGLASNFTPKQLKYSLLAYTLY